LKGRTTIHDIAKALDTTAATVSRALNDHPAISDATKQEVREMARILNYQQNKLASALRSGRSNILGVLIPTAEINFFGSVVQGIQQVANEHHYSIIIYQSNESSLYEKKGIEAFLRSRVDGVIASVSKEGKDWSHFEELIQRGVPLVLFDRVPESLPVPTVTINDFQGGYQATQSLLELGCKKIVHIAGPTHLSIFKNRLLGYQAALEDAGIAFESDWVLEGDLTVESSKKALWHALDRISGVDGVFAAEDFMALGAMQALKEKGMAIPKDVAVVGFANEGFSAYITPSLSTVDQQTRKMGEEAARLFFQLYSKGSFYDQEPVQVILDPVLISRESTQVQSTSKPQQIISKTNTKSRTITNSKSKTITNSKSNAQKPKVKPKSNSKNKPQ